MTFYFVTIGKDEFLLEFDGRSIEKVINAIKEHMTTEIADPLPSDEPPLAEDAIKRLSRQGIVKIIPARRIHISSNYKKAYVRDLSRSDEEMESDEY